MKTHGLYAVSRICFAVIMFVGLSVLPSLSYAETNIAVVDVQRLLNESKAAKSIQKQLNTHKESFQSEFSVREKKLRETELKLSEGREKLSVEAFGKQKTAFEENLMETRQLAQKRRRELETAANEALISLRQEIVKIVADMADKEKYDLIMTKQNIILAAKAMDVTDVVMKKLNSKITKIDLKIQTN